MDFVAFTTFLATAMGAQLLPRRPGVLGRAPIFPAAPAAAAPTAPIGKIRGTGVCIVLFIVIACVFGLGGRPKGDASGTRAVRALQSFGTLAGGASRPVPVR